ncbi:MAG: 16S rRNA processing protein RimM [bacterium TMED88]|nr:16S rRNA processing protein RimM [Deltaproteobacteria bacterium]OUV34128.1 MAG: 16S rRNA processing protein RimM [bacterium TMED88]
MKTQGSVVEIGRVTGAHGLRGEVRVRWFGDGPETLLSLSEVRLGSSIEDPKPTRYPVHRVGTGRAGEVRLALEGVSDRDAAVALRGLLVLMDAEDLEPLGADDFYWHELIGCRVETTSGEAIGTVRELWDSGRHDVLVVERVGKGQVLIPTAREIMVQVDRESRRIVVQDIPGLIDGEGA